MTAETKYEFEVKLLYSIIVAGKSATFAENAIGKFFMMGINKGENPFAYVRRLVKKGSLEEKLRSAKTGNYGKIAKAFTAVIDLDAKTCTIEQLEAIHGIGPKTARFFVMWTRENQNYAALDTHILKWMKYLGFNVPKSTPSGEKYAKIEKQFLAESERRGIGARDLDAMIWEYCHSGGHKSGQWPGILGKIK